MDIRKPKIEPSDGKTTRLDDLTGGGDHSARFIVGAVATADAKMIIPPAIQGKLSALGKKYNLPFDLSNIGMDGKMADNVKAMRRIADMVSADSKLLPEMMKQIKRLLKAEIKLVEFHKNLVSEALKHQEKIDKATADIFLQMAGYQSRSTKLEHRTNARNAIKEKRTQAYTNHYQNTVFASEAEIIDAEYELLASNGRILKESNLERMNLNSERRNRINDYVQSAYRD
jgi:hypothetical protein